MAIDEGCPGQMGWYFHQQLWISGQCGQGFSFRLLGKAMRWQTWVSHASPSLHVGQLTLEEVSVGGGCWWGQKHDLCFLVNEDFGDGLLPWQEGLGERW